MGDRRAVNIDREAFITEVERRKALWEGQRRNAVFERQLWAEVSRKFHIPVADCRGIWKEIKNAFISELHRCKRDGVIYSSVWASRLRFLLGETFIGREIGELLNWRFFNVVPTWASCRDDWRNKVTFEWLDMAGVLPPPNANDVCPHCFNRMSTPPQWLPERSPAFPVFPPHESSFVSLLTSPMNIPFQGTPVNLLVPTNNFSYSSNLGVVYGGNESNASTSRHAERQNNDF